MCTFLRIGILIVALSLLVQGDTDLAREPQQGTFITCEECVILYPEKYRDNPESCPVCHGKKEHFQPARMMNEQLARSEARELELRIEKFLIQTIKDAHESPVSAETLEKIRGLYREKLIFHLVHNQFELEPIKSYIIEMDELMSKSE